MENKVEKEVSKMTNRIKELQVRKFLMQLENGDFPQLKREEQTIVAIEELAELQQQLTKCLREKEIRQNLVEELADAQLMVLQMRILYNVSDEEIFDACYYKIMRLKEEKGLQ